MKSYGVTIRMKATEQYFPAVLHVYYAVQGGSNFWVWIKSSIVTIQSYWLGLSFLFIMLYKVVLTFWVGGWNPSVFWKVILGYCKLKFVQFLCNLLFYSLTFTLATFFFVSFNEWFITFEKYFLQFTQFHCSW